MWMERDENKKKRQQHERRPVERARASQWAKSEMEDRDIEQCSCRRIKSVGTAEQNENTSNNIWNSVHCMHSACMGMAFNTND